MLFRRRIKNEYQQLLDTLDRILAGEEVEEHFDETMDAAVVDRVKRIMEMVSVNKGKAEAERDTVKSLVSDIGHQIRTPLSNISLYSELLSEHLTNANDIKLANIIGKNVDTLEFHMQALLKASYAEQDLISVNPKKTDIYPVVIAACQRIEGMALKKEIFLHDKCGKEFIFADGKWTEEALYNVFDNAVKYSPNGSHG